MATGSDVTPEAAPTWNDGRNIRPSEVFWSEVTLWNDTRRSLRGFPWMRCAHCSISALVGPFHRKWRHQASRDPGSYNLIIFYELALSLVFCPFHAILFSWGVPSIIIFLTKVCCFRICSRCCVVLEVVYHVRVAFLLYFQRSFNVLFINCSFFAIFCSWTFYL